MGRVVSLGYNKMAVINYPYGLECPALCATAQ